MVGGVNRQNRVYRHRDMYGTFRAGGSYALGSLHPLPGDENFVRGTSITCSTNHDTNGEGSIVYGAPRNFSITGTYQLE